MLTRPTLLLLAIALVFGSCQKPNGYSGVEVFEISDMELLNCLSENHTPNEERVTIVRSVDDLYSTEKFALDVDEVGNPTSMCYLKHELEDFNFSFESLLQITYSYNDFDGREDGDYVIRYFEHKDDPASIFRLTLREEKGHEADMEDVQWNTIWVAVPALSDDHVLEFEKQIDAYRQR